MRSLSVRISVAVLTFAAGITFAELWYIYKQPAVTSLGLPPCASAPDYELVALPCAVPDLSGFSTLPVIRYCELIRDASQFEGRVVRVRGIFSFNMENSWLGDPTCRSEDPFTWLISHPYSGFEEALVASQIGRNQAVEVVLLGKFYGPNGEGYGHLNGYRYQFSVMKLEEMSRSRIVKFTREINHGETQRGLWPQPND